MDNSSGMERFQQWAMNPWAVLACVLAGGALGTFAPGFSRHLDVVGIVYVDLLKMIVLPFMVSAVIFSLQSLYREGGAGKIVKRVVQVFVLFSFVAAIVAAAASLVLRPGAGLQEETRAALGQLVSANSSQGEGEMAMYTVEEAVAETTLRDVLATLIPSNIFASLASGETLKALVFALLFGFAVGQIPNRVSMGLQYALETIYKACQTLTRWVNLPLPLVLVCMSASQIAVTGLQPLRTMAGFVAAFAVIAGLLLALAIWAISRRADLPFSTALAAMREPFALGVATNNTAACMPAMVSALAEHLNFARSRVELLVPLSASLLRVGSVTYFVCATIFIAALYSSAMSAGEVGLLVLIAVLAGFASAGMTGVVTITLVGTICAYLKLPFEAAFVLLVAVDPICAMARTAVNVIGSCAAIAAICPKPIKL